MSRVAFDWRGDELVHEMRAAARDAVNDIVDEAADDARANHEGWENRPTKWSKEGGQLEEEIVSEHAHPGDLNPTAAFGERRKRGFYGLFHELGTVHEHERPYLRPAADRHFPDLEGKIRTNFLLRRLKP